MGLKAFKSLLALAFLAMLSVSLALAEVTDTLTVNVTVAEVAEITVLPDYLSWNLNPGSAGEAQYVDIKNTGSVNVSNVYVYASTLTDETERPYGSSDPQKYAAAGLIVLKKVTDQIPQFVGRIEWNWTDEISGAVFSAVRSPVAWGFYKNTSFEYVWVVGNGTDGFCNNTGAQFAIEDDPDMGTTATRTPEDPVELQAGDENYGYFSVTGKAAFGGDSVCVAVAADCSKIYIYKYDKRNGFSACTNSAFLTNQLAPGDILRTSVNAYVPKGIPAGTLKVGTLTFVASS